MDNDNFINTLIPHKIVMMMELDGEIGSGNWYPVITDDGGTYVYYPYKMSDGRVAWKRRKEEE